MADDNEDIGRRLARIQEERRGLTQSTRAGLGTPSSDDDSSDDEQKNANDIPMQQPSQENPFSQLSQLTHSQASSVPTICNAQGGEFQFSQDMSTATSTANRPPLPPVNYRPAPRLLELGNASQYLPSPSAEPGYEYVSHPFPQYNPQLDRAIGSAAAAPGGRSKKKPSRAGSPAISDGSAKKMPKKKSAAEKAEEKAKKEAEKIQLQITINAFVANFKQENRSKIVCQEESNEKTPQDLEQYPVAKWYTVFKGKPNEMKLDIAKFNSAQIRKLAMNCGVKGGGNLAVFAARRMIASSKTMGDIYNDNTLVNHPKTSPADMKVNTMFRSLNVVFLPHMIDKFVSLNDPKKRSDYEEAHGSSPIKNFWRTGSTYCNEVMNNGVLGVILETESDWRLKEFADSQELNLNNVLIQTYESLQQNVNDAMKAREVCLTEMRKSGQHSNDLWTYAINPALTKLRNSSGPVPAKVVYYCHVLCSKHPQVDGKFSAFLSESLKSDSSVPMTGTANEGGTGTRGRSNKPMETLVETLVSASTTMRDLHEQRMASSVQQQRQQPSGDQDGPVWNEYFGLIDRFLDLKGNVAKLPLLRVMSLRIRKLETTLGVTTESVLIGVEGIPVPQEVVTTTTDDSTSDMTTTRATHNN